MRTATLLTVLLLLNAGPARASSLTTPPQDTYHAVVAALTGFNAQAKTLHDHHQLVGNARVVVKRYSELAKDLSKGVGSLARVRDDLDGLETLALHLSVHDFDPQLAAIDLALSNGGYVSTR